ncbi:MAG: glycosyltransferase N-terminal domain-containing protein [Bacteroidales bacterium]|nr:glycosyltransferase N-terminal domain-containing protein [Bacteroidales bacterium]
MRFFYTLTILFYGLAIRVASLFNRKAAQWIHGRRDLFAGLEEFKKSAPSPLIWFHCASLGEFEQGRTLMERIKKVYPGHRILLTFFSPSGYEIRKDYPLADHVTYLPLDTPWNARRFVQMAQPEIVFFIKYEYWYNFLSALHREHIPVYITAAIFRQKQLFFRWYGTWFRSQLDKITCLFVQNESSLELLHRYGITNAIVCGDTRFDRVKAVAENPLPFPQVERFAYGYPLLMAGSTWPEDEELLIRLMEATSGSLRFVIAPHEIHPDRIQSLLKRIRQPAVTFSSLQGAEAVEASILVIDTMGMLSHLYRYATIVYVGGGFGKGIHNILEAAAFSKPILFGPNHRRFREADDLIRSGGAKCISSAEGLISAVQQLTGDPDLYRRSADAGGQYVKTHTGATDKIIDSVQSHNKSENDQEN